MKIAILTFFDVANFGANLQLISTYSYLKNQGHEVVALDYSSYKTIAEKFLSKYKRKLTGKLLNPQIIEHHRFINEQITEQIHSLHSCQQVRKAIIDNRIEGVIIGSDAVVQHWPLFSTLKLGIKRPFWIEPLQQERRFPNPFWGVRFANEVPTVMMSVSSQNSKYQLFSKSTLKRMSKQLKLMKYISVRDIWTRDMMCKADSSLDIEITPDPVFALNQNVGSQIPTENEIRSYFSLPVNYVLVGLRSQVFSVEQLKELNDLMKEDGKECVAFSVDGIYGFNHPFSYTVPLPLSPLYWFALIKYASAYIGSNMHPIVSSLANGVPCYSIDNWGTVDFFGRKKIAASSKVYDVLAQYGLQDYRSQIDNGVCKVDMKDICMKIKNFPIERVKLISDERYNIYDNMMQNILKSFVSTTK